MPAVVLHTHISAPCDDCFNLSRSIDLHLNSMKHFEERAIGGRISGLITLGETVTWRAKHFLLWHEMTVKITQFEYPKMFCDEMVAGPFKFFRHEHIFTPVSGGTVMTDILHYALPFPLLTTFLDVVLLRGYMKELLLKRNAEIKGLAENVSENNLA